MNNIGKNTEDNDPLNIMENYTKDQPSHSELYSEFFELNESELDNEENTVDQNY